MIKLGSHPTHFPQQFISFIFTKIVQPAKYTEQVQSDRKREASLMSIFLRGAEFFFTTAKEQPIRVISLLYIILIGIIRKLMNSPIDCSE